MITRREAIKRTVSLIAAPAIIRVAGLMPVKAIEPVWAVDFNREVYTEFSTGYEITRKAIIESLYENHTRSIHMGLIQSFEQTKLLMKDSA